MFVDRSCQFPQTCALHQPFCISHLILADAVSFVDIPSLSANTKKVNWIKQLFPCLHSITEWLHLPKKIILLAEIANNYCAPSLQTCPDIERKCCKLDRAESVKILGLKPCEIS